MMESDTIVARATAPGVGAVALIRMSGPAALSALRAVAPEFGQGVPEARHATLATVRHPVSGEVADQVLVTVFPGPASYTGEDVVEIGCHGGVLAPTLVLNALLAAGAREAEPGEFTRRAYLNGKMDLVQAEATLDLVEGRSSALHRAALRQLDRGLSRRVDELRERLVRLEAHLVHHLDFPEEDEPATPAEDIAREAETLRARLGEVTATAAEGVLLRRGALVVLAGPPNAGKSSLFNALAGEDRALVTEIPGTTRDSLEVEVSMGGYPFRLVDTAGLRETGERVERMGIEVAERYLQAADVVLFCLPVNAAMGSEAQRFLEAVSAPVLLLRTKADEAVGGVSGDGPLEAVGVDPAADGGTPSSLGGKLHPRGTVEVSSQSGDGLADLRATLRDMVFSGLVEAAEEAPVITRERQADAVRHAESEVAAFAAALRSGVPAELASAHLKDAATALESLLGIVHEEEVLDHLFESFCIGK